MVKINMDNIKEIRLKSIDGLRGISCLSVVCFHFFNETFKNDSILLYNFFSRFIFDGQMAVAIFFIISGEALSVSFIENKNAASIFRPAVKRWPRLSIPVFFSAVLVFFISKMHWVYNREASVIVNRQDWLGEFLKYPPHVVDIFKFSFISVFGKHPKNTLNPFLWTMHFELIGSFFLFFLFFLIYKKLSYIIPFFFLIIFFAFGIKTDVFLSCFALGFLLSYARKTGFFEYIKTQKYSKYYVQITIAIFFIIEIISKKFYFSTGFLFFKSGFLTLFLLSNTDTCKFLDSKLIQFLGKISFPLFLFQFPILISFTSYLITKYYYFSHIPSMAIFIATSSVVLSIILATILYPIETLTQKICNYIYKKTKIAFNI